MAEGRYTLPLIAGFFLLAGAAHLGGPVQMIRTLLEAPASAAGPAEEPAAVATVAR